MVRTKSRGNTEFRLAHLSGPDGDFVAAFAVCTRRCTLYAARELRKNAPCELSSPRDNGKMNAKWRTRRHLSIRDLDRRSLFLSDSSFHAIDDHTGLRERSGGSSFLFFFFCFFFFFSFLSFSFETVTQQSSILRLRCAALNLNYYARKEFSCLPACTLRLSRESLQLPIMTYTILGAFYSLQGRFHSGFLFILLSYFSCLPAPETTWKSSQCRQELSKFLRMYLCMNHRR